MLEQQHLKELLSQDFSDKEKMLLILASNSCNAIRVKDIREIAISSGWRKIQKKNISTILSRSTGLAILTNEGWELTKKGMESVSELLPNSIQPPIQKTAFSLREHLNRITDSNTYNFVEESIICFEAKQYRAAVVLSWAGAISLIQCYIIQNKLNDFNIEASRRFQKWKNAKNTDDLGLMKEDDFLDILQSISVIGKNVKQELKKALILRNGCGHPNSLSIAENKVAAHIEDLILNVFSVFIVQ